MKIDRKAVHAKYNGRCAYCGDDIALKTMQVDHIKPQTYGGTDDIENLNPACRVCNNFKYVWNLEQFRKNLESQVEKARKYSGQFRRAEKYGLIKVVKSKVVFYFEKNKGKD